ncbi:MAG TPA: alpha-2-macroglobulin, partial [Burkholderiaceae bacterium]|nr:alpha-2-macroglobulin [Burkholderiaceae bacterium]
MQIFRRACALGLGLGIALAFAHGASAATIRSFSPQNEVAQVRQVRVSFSEAAVKFGDPKAPVPFDIQCSEAGSGRWADERNWVYDFVRDLPPGTRCAFTLKADFKALSGVGFAGKTAFRFHTGGPAVRRTIPGNGATADPEQVFLLVQNGAATDDSLRQHLFCEAAGVHERIPVKLVSGPVRQELLKHFVDKLDPQTVSTVQCQQRLPAGAKMQLVWDRGIATPTGVATSVRQVFKFQVLEEFSASFSCQRENANAACAPILPVRLTFSAPVSRQLAEGIVLNGAAGRKKPYFAQSDNEPTVMSVEFKPPFAESSEFTLTLPAKFQDLDGRPLVNAALFPLKSKMGPYPPLAKFAAAPFGILELNADAVLPLTLRNVEVNLPANRSAPGTIASLKLDSDADIIDWIAKLDQYHENTVY